MKPALTASSFTTRTPTRWLVSSAAQNDREDGYGGSRENRVRLPLEVYRAVRDRVGDDYVVGVRFLADEVIAGGSRVEDAIYYAKEFARAGL